MKTHYKTLIVEDHGVVVNGIKTTLNKITESTGTTFEIYFATNFSDAISILNEDPPIELVFLDIKLPPEPDIEMFSGEDLGVVIRKLNPDTTIIVFTAYNDPVRIKNIINIIKPEGFFVKGDISPLNLAPAIEESLKKKFFYSSTVVQSLQIPNGNDSKLDTRDIRLLQGLDIGLTLEKIGEVILLTRSGVYKRKKNLKQLLGIPKGNDRDLIKRARELGFI